MLAAGKMSIFRGGENFFRRNFLPLQLYKWINLLRENSFGKNSRSLRSIYTKSTSVCSSRIPSPFDILIVVHIFPFFFSPPSFSSFSPTSFNHFFVRPLSIRFNPSNRTLKIEFVTPEESNSLPSSLSREKKWPSRDHKSNKRKIQTSSPNDLIKGKNNYDCSWKRSP